MEGFKNQDAASYDAVAERFARLTDLTTKPLAARMTQWAGLRPHDNVLDVGTGTGVVALIAAQQLSTPGTVCGLDLSSGQLAIARRRAEQAGLSDRVRFELGDAERLPFESQSFDVVLSLYALFHFPQPHTALSEMFRVLRKGGRLVVGVGSGPTWTNWYGWWHRLTRVPDFVRLKQHRLLLAHSHLEGLVRKHLPPSAAQEVTELARGSVLRGDRIAPLVRRAGFTDIRLHWEGRRLVFDDAEQFWELQSTFSTVCRKRLAQATAQQVGRLRAEFFASCRRTQARRGTLEYHHGALFVGGGKHP